MTPVSEVLEEHSDEIIAGWLVLIQDAAGPLYADRPRDELYRMLSRGLSSLITFLGTGDDQQLHRHVNALVHQRSVQGFHLAEVQRAFLGLREVLWPILDSTYLDRSGIVSAVKAIDVAMTHATLEFSQAYEAQVTQRLQQLAITDPLTGLFNRRYLDLILHNELRRIGRAGEPLSLLFIVIDYFKPYNDQHGHLEGDQALQIVAGVLRDHVRTGDVVTRYGGEEFVILLPKTPLPAAAIVAERLRHAMAGAVFPGEPAPQRLTISVGVATTAKPVSSHHLLRMADEAAYEAKSQGRNRVVIGTEPGACNKVVGPL
ncbi:MAG: diguanylate cyclase [Candidatus Sericytochromatia bacterium]|nr:diguanylate cyclase [Candidatus Sericytochromatia bacterium]